MSDNPARPAHDGAAGTCGRQGERHRQASPRRSLSGGMGKLLRFRRLRHGDPEKLKVLAEDIRRDRRDGISWPVFAILTTVAAVLIFAAVMMAGEYPFSGI